MRWVKLILPPRVRPRYPLITSRLTSSSLAGTSRKLVAVGTSRLASMLVTIRAAAPRSGWLSGSVGGAGFVATAAFASVAAAAGRLVTGAEAGVAPASRASWAGTGVAAEGGPSAVMTGT